MSMTSAPRRLRGQELLAAVAEGTAGAVGEEFLRCLARNVAEAFAAKLVLIAEADDPTGQHVRALVCWYDGAFVDEPIEYDTAGQPCAVITDYPWVSFPEALTERFPNDTPAVELGLESYLAVCLRSSQNVHLGHIAVLDARPMDAGEEDVAALRIFAARAAAELERRNQARALEESRARVIEAADAERRRVGRDLHDGAQQRLLAVSNLLKVARMKADAPAEELLATAAQELEQAHAELRELARGLHPVALSERGLRSALESLCAAAEHEVVLDVTDEDLPDPIAAAAYFVAAESLANSARYAQASRVEVRIQPRAGELHVEVADDGVGGADTTAGTGLSGLADRVEVLKGCFDVESPPGAGTRVHASIPLGA
jgi:signal transduction histidine kinase